MSDLDRAFEHLTTDMRAAANPERAPQMEAYLKDKFACIGVSMDVWIDDANFWVARAAILHQLRYKESLNEARLFGYVLKRSGDTEFFIRKALGWALRSHARVAPVAVRDSPNAGTAPPSRSIRERSDRQPGRRSRRSRAPRCRSG